MAEIYAGEIIVLVIDKYRFLYRIKTYQVFEEE